MIVKNESYICPECGTEDTDTIDYEWDVDCMSIKMSCNRCYAVWREFFLLKYDGYYNPDEHAMYDADGKRCSDQWQYSQW